MKSFRSHLSSVFALCSLAACDVPPEPAAPPAQEVEQAQPQALFVDYVQNPNVTAAQNAGATFVGLVPKLPLHVLNQTLGAQATAMAESLMGCTFPTSAYLDDEDNSNIDDLTVNGASYRHQNALLGGFGHPPSSSGSAAGVNSLVSFCQVPVRTLPRTKLDYMVFAAHEKIVETSIFGVRFKVPKVICPAGSVKVTVEVDTEIGSTNRVVGGEWSMFAPNEVLAKNAMYTWDPSKCSGPAYSTINGIAYCDGPAPSGTTLTNSGSARFSMCFVPADPNAATELPTTFDVFNGSSFVSVSAQNYIYMARDAGFEPGSGRATFFQDGEDSQPRSWISVSDAQYDSRVRRIVQISSGSDVTWNLGWGGWNPPIGVAPNYDPAPPPQSCFENPFQGSCLSQLAQIGAKALAAYAKQ